MIIIADSGGTKTEWRSVGDEGVVCAAQTAGMNPSAYGADHFVAMVNQAMPLLNPDGENVDKIYFYGAGLLTTASVAPIDAALKEWCPSAFVDFRSDLLAAARALFADGEGIVAIMGTGSNSCLYRDGKIMLNYRPGGFILGDDGSAASLGKAFISDVVRSLTPTSVYCMFREEYDLPYQVIVENVYHKPGAAAFLGSFAPFILKNIDEPSGYFRSLVEGCIDAFMKSALTRYKDGDDEVAKVGVVGSFGCACEEYVREIGERYAMEFVKFLKSPIDELVPYHCKSEYSSFRPERSEGSLNKK